MLREWNPVLADADTPRSRGPSSTAGAAPGSWSRSSSPRRCTGPAAPGTVNLIGLSNIAPAIMTVRHRGAEGAAAPPHAARRRHLVPGILRARRRLRPREPRATAVRDGDDYVINGQKTWNTLGHIANWCELLVRTDPEAPKHSGISCLLVDMTVPGVEVRPLTTIAGDSEFNEIFFTDVRVPVSALLGGENEGWRVAMTTLTHERGGVAQLHLGLRAKIRRLLDAAKANGAAPAEPVDPPAARAALPRGRAAEAAQRAGDLRRAARTRARAGGVAGQARVEREVAARRRGRGRRARRRTRTPAPGAATASHALLHDRRRHHPSEQEHHRPPRPRPPPQVTPPDLVLASLRTRESSAAPKTGGEVGTTTGTLL